MAVVGSRTEAELLAGILRSHGLKAAVSADDADDHVNAGDVLFVPAGAVHAVRNVGSGNAAELATYVVEKGKPILALVE